MNTGRANPRHNFSYPGSQRELSKTKKSSTQLPSSQHVGFHRKVARAEALRLKALLASIGVYDVISYAVSLRTHEIGLRMALGSPGSKVLAQVVREGLLVSAIGVGIGLAGSIALSGSFETMVFGITPTDPLTYGGVVSVLMAAAGASLVPARRASRVDPMVALRVDNWVRGAGAMASCVPEASWEDQAGRGRAGRIAPRPSGSIAAKGYNKSADPVSHSSYRERSSTKTRRTRSLPECIMPNL